MTLATELRLIKASLLYADRISLYSSTAILFDSVAMPADAPDGPNPSKPRNDVLTFNT